MAAQFPASRSGVEQLMQQYGRGREDVVKALNMLNNPMVANTLGRIPGVTDTLKSYGAKLLETSQDTVPSVPAQPSGNDLLSRLSRLK